MQGFCPLKIKITQFPNGFHLKALVHFEVMESPRIRRQRGWVVSASESESGGPGFESRSGNLLELFWVVLSSNPWPHLQIANWLPPASWGC